MQSRTGNTSSFPQLAAGESARPMPAVGLKALQGRIPAKFWQTASFPEWGIVSVVAGYFSAVTLMPADIHSQGAMIWPGLALAIGLCAMPFAASVRRPLSLFRAEHILAMSPVYWILLDIIQGAYELKGVDRRDVESSLMAISLFSGMVYLACVGRPWKLPKFIDKAKTIRLSADTYFALALVAFVIAILRFAIPVQFSISEMIEGLGKARFYAPWSRGRLGGWDAVIDHMGYFGYILPTLTVVIAYLTKWTDRRTIVTGLCSIVILIFLSQAGGRRIIGVCVGSALLAYVLLSRRYGFRQMVTLAVCGVVLLATLQLMLQFRSKGWTGLFEESRRQELAQTAYIRVDDNFLRLTQVMSIFPEHRPHVGTRWLTYIAVRPIPRVLWPGKPTHPGFDLAVYLREKGVSFSMSTIGELYMAFGWTGVVVGGLLLGRLARSWTTIIESSPNPGGALLYGLGTMAPFAGMRSAIELILMSYAIVAWIVLVKFFGRRGAKAARSDFRSSHVQSRR